MIVLRALLLGAGMAAVAGTASAQQRTTTPWTTKAVPMAVFGQASQIDTPRLSPGGKWLATKVRAAEGQALAILPVGSKGAAQVIARDGAEARDKQGDRQIRSWRWLDDDHLLVAMIYRDNLFGEWIDIQRFAVFNRTTGKSIPLAWDDTLGSTLLMWASDSGRPHVLLQRANVKNSTERWNRPEVVDVDADTGAVRLVQPTNPVVQTWDADSDGVIRFGANSDGNTGTTRLLYRADGNGVFRTIVKEKVSLYDNTATPDLLLRGGKAYAYSRKDGYRALYDYDLATMTLGRKVYGVDGYDIGGALVSPDRTRLDGYTVTKARETTIFVDPRLKEIQALLEEKYGAGNVDIESADTKREIIAFRVSKPGQAPGFYIYDTVGGGIGLLGWQNEALQDAQLNPVRMMRYPASDGRTIEAVLTMPRHRAGEKALPLVILPHGGPWARDSADWDPYNWAQAIAELGYVVIQPNFRGSTGYGTAWEKAAEGNWGYRMSDDLNDAIPWLAAQGIADAKRVCIFGWSYGGYASARAAQRDGAKYRCAIAGAAPVDMTAMVQYDRNYLGRYRAKQALGSASGNLDDISPALHADQVSTPILIVHGAKDQRVPVAQARGFVARLKRAGKIEGKDFEYLEQPQNTHNLQREADRVQLLERLRDFLARHNPA